MGAANVKLLQGVKTMNQRQIKLFDKAVAVKTVVEVSRLLADDPDYEKDLQHKLEKLLEFVNKAK